MKPPSVCRPRGRKGTTNNTGQVQTMDKQTIMRKAISDALEQLLEDADSLQDISVKDILEKCGLSRPTFYRYFSDKYDVVNWSYTYYVEELTDLYGKSAAISNENLLRRFIRFFYDKRNYFYKVMDYVGQNSFYDHYLSCLTRWYAAVRDQSAGEAAPLSVEERYMLLYFAAGISRMLKEWLLGGCKESPEQILEIITQNMPEKLRRFTL